MNSKIVDLVLLVLVVLYFIGLLAFEYHSFGLENPILQIPIEFKAYFEGLIWPIIALLIFDLILKYRKINDPKKFVKKHWFDIFMLALIPVFSIFKFLKVGLSMIRKLKVVKMAAKILHKIKKVHSKKKFKQG